MKTNKDLILLLLIWLIIILSLLYAVSTNGAKTKLVLEAHAQQDNPYTDFVFGDRLRESQLDMEVVYNRIEAVRTCEGWYKEGSLAQINNNMGNFKAGGVTDRQGHTIFQAPLDSYMYMLKYFFNRQDQTMYQISRYYATASDRWLNCVTHSL